MGLLYHLYNQFAFNTLARVSPVSHGVCNVVKRVAIIATSGENPTPAAHPTNPPPKPHPNTTNPFPTRRWAFRQSLGRSRPPVPAP